MKTSVVTESWAFSLRYWDFNVSTSREVSWAELKKAELGEEFWVDSCSNCGRGVHEESAKVVFKDNEGVAVLFRTDRTADTPEAEDLGREMELRWFQFLN